MADITYTRLATERRLAQGLIPGRGDANTLRMLCTAEIELAAGASGVTFKLGRIPAHSRISNLSRISWDDLATSGSPTINVGLGSVDSNITSDPTALGTGFAVSSASATGSPLLGDFANGGKRAWELVSGQTTDPGGMLDIYGTIKTAATNATGSVLVEVYGYTD